LQHEGLIMEYVPENVENARFLRPVGGFVHPPRSPPARLAARRLLLGVSPVRGPSGPVEAAGGHRPAP
jgi:hypothetical protein